MRAMATHLKCVLISFYILVDCLAADPVEQRVSAFIKNCDCSYQSVTIVKNKQIGQAVCHCPGHILQSFHVACDAQDEIKGFVTVQECALDDSLQVTSQEEHKEKRTNKVKSEQGVDNAVHAK